MMSSVSLGDLLRNWHASISLSTVYDWVPLGGPGGGEYWG